jgi:hypothetical protein
MTKISIRDLPLDAKHDEKFKTRIFGGALFIGWVPLFGRLYHLDPQSGYLTFHDGAYGMRPQEGDDIRADYRD